MAGSSNYLNNAGPSQTERPIPSVLGEPRELCLVNRLPWGDAGRAKLCLLLILTGLGRLASAGCHSETSLLQITVPRNTETNPKDGNISETHVINKSL